MLLLLFAIVATFFNCSVFAQNCKSVDFGSDSIVCECNSTYCDFYTDPEPPGEGQFIWYVSSKSGDRLKRSDGEISDKPENKVTVTINSRKSFQRMEGFGGAFTDAASINIKSLSEKTQDNLMKSYFSNDGIKYNFGRTPIGGSDFSTRAYSYDDSPEDMYLTNFTLANEDYEYKIPLMQRALELNPSIRFLASSWTAPPWMKNKKVYNEYSYLLEKYYQVYADYIAKFLDEYKKHGLKMWTVSTGNEPLTALIPFSHINKMFWTPNTASKWVLENLGPTLERTNNNDTKILMLDDQRINLPLYPLTVKSKYNGVFKYVIGFGLHWYLDFLITPSVLDRTHDALPDKFLLITEACVGDRPWQYPKVILGSWSRAELIIDKMFQNFNHWVVGWIDWNLALNREGGPNWVKNYVDSPIIVVPEKDIFYKQPLFYAMAHFSKFVPRSSVKIESTSSDKHILSNAFKTENNLVVVVLYNGNNNKKTISIVDEAVGSINIELPERSLHTILYKTA